MCNGLLMSGSNQHLKKSSGGEGVDPQNHFHLASSPILKNNKSLLNGSARNVPVQLMQMKMMTEHHHL